MDFKLCSNCADVFYALDDSKDPEKWHIFNVLDVQTPQSVRWHLIRNIWVSQTAEINIGTYMEGTVKDRDARTFQSVVAICTSKDFQYGPNIPG